MLGHVGALEQGRSLPSYTALHRMRENLGINLDELFESARLKSTSGAAWWEAELVSLFAPLMETLTDERHRKVLTTLKGIADIAKLSEGEKTRENCDLR
jgi:transcriptional regulator with XRE-family HTH domain